MDRAEGNIPADIIYYGVVDMIVALMNPLDLSLGRVANLLLENHSTGAKHSNSFSLLVTGY